MFWRKSQPVITPKKRSKKVVKTLEQIADESFLKIITKNPAIGNKFIQKLNEKKYGVTVEDDPVEEAQKELNTSIIRAALDVIKNDPTLKEELARSKAQEILGIKAHRSNRGEGKDDSTEMMFDDESPITKTLREMEEIDELKERLGGGNSSWSFLKDPDVIKALLGFLVSMRGNGSEPQIQERVRQVPVKTYVITDSEGKMVELSESDYLKLKAGTAKQLEEKKEPEVKQETVQEDPILKLLELGPEDFVKEITAAAKSDEQMKYIKDLLQSGKTFEDIKAMLEPYKDTPPYSIYIEKILSKEEWCNKVIELFNQPVKESEAIV